MMESGKRSKNFTEREKMLLVEVAKEFAPIINNIKTDGPTVQAKKDAWSALTNKYNALAETGSRTEKQLHALYDNLKKRARRSFSDLKSQMYKTEGDTYNPKSTAIDEKLVAMLTPQLKPINIEFDSSESYCSIDIEKKEFSSKDDCTPSDFLEVIEHNEDLDPSESDTEEDESSKSHRTHNHDAPKATKMCLSEINNISTSIIKRKLEKQFNEDAITKKRLEILEIQKQQEIMKLEKTKILLDLDIEIKRVLLENAKIELEKKMIKQ